MSPPIVSFSPPCFVVEEVLLWKGKLSRVDDPFYEKFQMWMLVELAEEHQSLFAGAGGLFLFRIPYLVAAPSTPNKLELEALVGSLAYPIHHVEVKNVVGPGGGGGGGRRAHILMDRAQEMAKMAVARRTTELLVSGGGGGPAGKATEVDKVVKDKDEEDDDDARRRRRFDIVADVKIDTYYLAAADTAAPRSHDDLVYIPNIATSAMMNSVFRNVKEKNHHNLECAEESEDEDEDEDEFEDTSEDNKYVNLDKRARFLCEFHPKFLKWVPIQFICNVHH